METQKLKQLLTKYNSGLATAEEKAQIESWYDSIQGDDNKLTTTRLSQIKEEIHNNLWAYINKPNTGKGRIYSLIPYYKWAAAVLLLAGLTFFYFQYPAKQQVVQYMPATQLKNDITPGGNQAILTLANGNEIVLDSVHNGSLAKEGQTVVSKKNSGLLAYQSSGAPAATEILYNTITTPRGGQYQVILPDGSKVWLNAASSLKFPTAFTGKERNVELMGEAYFEVAKNKDMPFHVSSAGQVIEVLGTHFNINAYTDEPTIKTTLLEGSVKVVKGMASALLKPGQQSAIDNSTIIKVTDDVDTDEVMAWKNGSFYFNNADIKTVMRQIGRWYNVDIEYNGDVPNDRFSGKFSKNMNASNALKILAFTGVNFKIEGRKIIVK